MQQSHIFVTAIKYDILKVWRINDFNFFRVKKIAFRNATHFGNRYRSMTTLHKTHFTGCPEQIGTFKLHD